MIKNNAISGMRSVVAVSFALLLAVPSVSMGCEGKEGWITKRVESVSEKLALNDEQRTKFTHMLEELRDKRVSMRENKDIPKETRRQVMQAVVQGKKQAFQDMLTEEQRQKHPNFNPFKRNKHKGKKGRHS